MMHNNHSLRIWNLIGRYARTWNLDNWNLYSEQVVNFTINYGKFHGSISLQEITTVGSPHYGKIAIAFQSKGKGFPLISFESPFDVAEFIATLGVTQTDEIPVIGERAPMDEVRPCIAANGSN
jgi:hypothetical protein